MPPKREVDCWTWVQLTSISVLLLSQPEGEKITGADKISSAKFNFERSYGRWTYLPGARKEEPGVGEQIATEMLDALIGRNMGQCFPAGLPRPQGEKYKQNIARTHRLTFISPIGNNNLLVLNTGALGAMDWRRSLDRPYSSSVFRFLTIIPLMERIGGDWRNKSGQALSKLLFVALSYEAVLWQQGFISSVHPLILTHHDDMLFRVTLLDHCFKSQETYIHHLSPGHFARTITAVLRYSGDISRRERLMSHGSRVPLLKDVLRLIQNGTCPTIWELDANSLLTVPDPFRVLVRIRVRSLAADAGHQTTTSYGPPNSPRCPGSALEAYEKIRDFMHTPNATLSYQVLSFLEQMKRLQSEESAGTLPNEGGFCMMPPYSDGVDTSNEFHHMDALFGGETSSVRPAGDLNVGAGPAGNAQLARDEEQTRVSSRRAETEGRLPLSENLSENVGKWW